MITTRAIVGAILIACAVLLVAYVVWSEKPWRRN